MPTAVAAVKRLFVPPPTGNIHIKRLNSTRAKLNTAAQITNTKQ